MLCLKCGTKTEAEQVFCPECLEAMKLSPVKPGASVLLPERPDPAEKKASNPKKAIPLKEQNKRLRKWNRRLAIALVFSVLMLALSVTFLVRLWEDASPQSQSIGQNYSTIDPRKSK